MKNLILISSILLLNLQSCITPSKKIELVQSNVYFEHKKDYQPRGGNIRKMLENPNYKKPVMPDAYFINYDIVLKNNTGEKIEKVEIKSILKIYYDNKTEVINFNPLNQYETIHYESSPMWFENETISYSNDQLIHNEKLFQHNTNKIELKIDVFVKNSVGYSHTEYISLDEGIKNSWNNLNK